MNLLIISIPLLSSIVIFFLGRNIGHQGGKYIAILSITICNIISIKSLKEYIEGKTKTINIKTWFELGGIENKFNLIYDKESIIMCILISIITLIVIIYSYWYLSEDAHLNRFISYLLLFSVSMYIFVTSKNYLFSFLGWESVGIISYLLINFWFLSIQNNKCSIKALIFNKIGDIFYLFALLILSLYFYSYDYFYISNISSLFEGKLLSILSLFIIFAAMAKSAQIFLHCWLGDAMAGPTPVSALLHAATMVTAGIYLLLRSEILILNSIIIPQFISIIGTLTILFAGLSALHQNDIKKIIAYSTCAQIGYMFFAISILNPINASLYHLFTHGFFKALLFLSAGLIIHSFLLEQDLRKYGSMIFIAPLFYIFFFIGSLAIIGFPALSGFYSKDLILLHSLLNNSYSYIILLIGSILSSFYSFKIIYLTFFNSNHSISLFSFYHYLNNKFFLFPFIFILGGSLFIGYLFSSFFSSPENLSIELESSLLTFNNILYSNAQIIPFLFPFITLFLFLIWYSKFPYSNLKNISSYSIYSIFNRKLFFDPFYNFFILKPLFFLSYHFSYKFIDRGYIEYIGPLSLFRLFFFFPKHFSLNNQLSSNLPYLFFYFFFSFFLLFCLKLYLPIENIVNL